MPRREIVTPAQRRWLHDSEIAADCMNRRPILNTARIARIAMFASAVGMAFPVFSAATPSLSGPPGESLTCRDCHASEVEGYARSTMDHSLRIANNEPEGVVRTAEGSISAESAPGGSWQVLHSGGTRSSFRVDYVIGSGHHASGYLIDIDNHLFQSPIAYYRRRHSYGLAPGFESTPDPGFTRPVTPGCLFCHAGEAVPVSGTRNEYASPPFHAMAIGCSRCHGSAAEHLADPGPGNIINPARLAPAARDSICEQCHLIGVARVLNPGKSFSDFKPGQPLEETFTIYHNVPPPGTTGNFRVISQAEELAMSVCARRSKGKLWCGTCHDPHSLPDNPISYYRAKCLACHNASFPVNHPSKTSNCIACHMPRRDTTDGGHTAFTDHRIQRRPEPEFSDPDEADIAAWREPAPALQKRNLGIALIEVGMQRNSPKLIVRGYRILTEVQTEFGGDSDLYTWMGNALLLGNQFAEAQRAFTIALRLDPDSPMKEADVGQAYAAGGAFDAARAHLERALQLDPLDLTAAYALLQVYQKQGDVTSAAALSSRLEQAMKHTVVNSKDSSGLR